MNHDCVSSDLEELRLNESIDDGGNLADFPLHQIDDTSRRIVLVEHVQTRTDGLQRRLEHGALLASIDRRNHTRGAVDGVELDIRILLFRRLGEGSHAQHVLSQLCTQNNTQEQKNEQTAS